MPWQVRVFVARQQPPLPGRVGAGAPPANTE